MLPLLKQLFCLKVKQGTKMDEGWFLVFSVMGHATGD